MGNQGADRKWTPVFAALAALALGTAMSGCGSDKSSGSGSDLSGTIRIEGSGAVAPLTEALARDFLEANPAVAVGVRGEGTGVGFHALCDGRIDIGNAAWTMDPAARKLCREGRVAYTEVPIAAQALVVLVNEQNPVDCLTTRQLEDIWDPKSTIFHWSEIRGLKEEFEEKLVLFGPTTDSPEFEYFSEATDGVVGGNRHDFRKTGEKGDAMFAGLAGAPGGLGYLNFLSYADNEGDGVKALEVDDGKGCVAPSIETAQDGSYVPLSRKMLLYLSRAALKRSAVKAFVDYYVANTSDAAESFGLLSLTEEQIEASEAKVAQAATG